MYAKNRKCGRSKTLRTTVARKHTGRTYHTPQPIDDPNAVARRLPGRDVKNPLHYDATTATIAYYQPETLPESQTEFRDDLEDERIESVTDFETDKDRIDDVGNIVTTTIEVGDVFFLGTYGGLYEYVGVTKSDFVSDTTPGDPDHSEELVFKPANKAAESTYRPHETRYIVYFKTDFSHKFSPYKITENKDKNHTAVRLDPELYDDMSHITEYSDTLTKPTKTPTNKPSSDENTTETSLIQTGRELITQIRDAIRDIRSSDPTN